MCEWTDKYPEGSEHWLFGKVVETDPGDEQPLYFGGDEWIEEYLLEKVEDKDHVLEKLIDSLGVDVVLKALEKRIGVPESVHWKTLKVGDTVEVDVSALRCQDEVNWVSKSSGPFYVKDLEHDKYIGDYPLYLSDGKATTYYWVNIEGIKGVHGDS